MKPVISIGAQDFTYNRGDLYEGLSIWEEEKYRQLQGRYPVIFLSFAGVKGDIYETARESIIQIIIDIYAKYRFLLQGDLLNKQEKEYFDFIKQDMSDAVASMSLHRLAICMNRYYGKKVIILLDEYDTPLQEAYVYGYWGRLIREGSPDIKIAMEDLLAGREIVSALDEEIVFDQLDESNEAVWSLLLASGYLKVDDISIDEDDDALYRLSLTNLEVKKEFRKMIQKWFKNTSARYNDFIKALLMDDVDYMNQYMNQIALQTFSSFDAGKKPSDEAEPERFYHGFILGMIVDLADQYRITSNRESGLGRYDVMMEPLKERKKAVVMEFKVFNPAKEKDLNETVKNALQQIQDKRYDTELIARGILKEDIRHYGFAFKGKTVLIR